MPPAFFEADQDKWKKKFEKARMSREQHKKLLTQRFGCEQTFGTANRNVQVPHISPLKRTNSRGSLPTFTPVDFDYKGDTSVVNHLIKDVT